MKVLTSLCLVFLLINNISAQDKYEKEYRISLDEVPTSAKLFVDSFGFHKKIKWYIEESLTGKSIEAKTKKQKQKYSIEFDTLGRLEDVEIQKKWKQLPNSFQQIANNHFENEFKKSKIIKVQEQFTGSESRILDYLLNKNNKNGLIIKYEIVVEGSDENGVKWYEYTFLENGEVEGRKNIIFKNIDNLEF
jgi:hypothetical protein